MTSQDNFSHDAKDVLARGLFSVPIPSLIALTSSAIISLQNAPKDVLAKYGFALADLKATLEKINHATYEPDREFSIDLPSGKGVSIYKIIRQNNRTDILDSQGRSIRDFSLSEIIGFSEGTAYYTPEMRQVAPAKKSLLGMAFAPAAQGLMAKAKNMFAGFGRRLGFGGPKFAMD